MSDKIDFNKPLEIKENSEARIALELLERITVAEIGNKAKKEDPRKYFLELYAQCRSVVKSGKVNY